MPRTHPTDRCRRAIKLNEQYAGKDTKREEPGNAESQRRKKKAERKTLRTDRKDTNKERILQMKEMTDYDKERLYTLRKERDNATKHLCPRVAAARQREIDKIMKRYGNV